MAQALFCLESYESRVLPVDAQRCVNMFLEIQPPEEGKSQVPLFGVQGLDSFATCGSGPIRGMWTLNGGLYVVSGNSLYLVTQNGTSAVVGTGIFGSKPVAMADNGTQLIIVNGVNGWVYDTTNGLVKIVNPAFYPARTVTFFDDYFVFDRVGTNQFFISEILDGSSYNALDFASAEASSKNIVGITQNLQLLFIFSEDHFEVWYDAGTLDFPFQRYAGGVVWRGCAASGTIIKQDAAIFFLGDDLVFYRLEGNVPIRVSNYGIEHLIAHEPNIQNAFCITHQFEGHKFIYLTLPESKRTLGYDTSSKKWHERISWDENDVSLGRWRANAITDAYGTQYVGDAFDGTIGTLNEDTFTEYGNTIQALIHSLTFHADKLRLYISRLELDMQVGVGLITGQGSDPQIMLRYSKDNGETWSVLQPWRSLGRIGEYLQRIRWLRLGSAYQWIFEVTISDPVSRTFIAAHIDAEPGMP